MGWDMIRKKQAKKKGGGRRREGLESWISSQNRTGFTEYSPAPTDIEHLPNPLLPPPLLLHPRREKKERGANAESQWQRKRAEGSGRKGKTQRKEGIIPLDICSEEITSVPVRALDVVLGTRGGEKKGGRASCQFFSSREEEEGKEKGRKDEFRLPSIRPPSMPQEGITVKMKLVKACLIQRLIRTGERERREERRFSLRRSLLSLF